MRKGAYRSVAMLVVIMTADAASARPLGQIRQERRAELYAKLSRDVSIRVHSRVDAAKMELENSPTRGLPRRPPGEGTPSDARDGEGK